MLNTGKLLIVLLVAGFCLPRAAILEVGSGTSGAYQAIQTAMDSAAIGDTVLVWPGTWVENLNYFGKNIVVTSRYLLDNDPAAIRATIIDGNQSGSCVVFRSGETRGAILDGFTITNGSGYDLGLETYVGGGIYIYQSGPTIKNCIIENNHVVGFVSSGGGICCRLGTNPLFSNLTVRYNSAGSFGGGIRIYNTAVEFDSVDRCNLYLNQGKTYNDVFHNDSDSLKISVYLDTFTVAAPVDDYFHRGQFSRFDIRHGKITPVAGDYFVSPAGDNTNSGLSPDDPIRHVFQAFVRSAASPDNPCIIKLLPGTYSLATTGERFPIALRSNIALEGSGRDSTIISLSGIVSSGFVAGNLLDRHSIADMTIRDLELASFNIQKALYINQSSNLLIDNIDFINIAQDAIGGTAGGLNRGITDSSSITINGCFFSSDNSSRAVRLIGFREAVVSNCKFEYNLPFYPPEWFANGGGIYNDGHVVDYPHPMYRRIEYCEFTHNFCDNSYALSGAASIGFDGSHTTDIVNCTFADNISTDYANIGIAGIDIEVRIVNCIMFGNEPLEIFMDGRLANASDPLRVIMSHNIIQGGEWGIGRTGNWELHYLDSNWSLNPQFVDPENGDYTLSVNSDAIDAGTALYIWEDDTVINLAPDQYYGSAPDLGAYEYTGVTATQDDYHQPVELSIASIYPNPFNSRAVLQYTVPKDGIVDISLYDLRGRHVRQCLTAWVCTGTHSTDINLSQFASGIYIIKIQQNNTSDQRTLTLLK